MIDIILTTNFPQCESQQTRGPGLAGGQEHQLHHRHERQADHSVPLPDEGARHPHQGPGHQGQGESLPHHLLSFQKT